MIGEIFDPKSWILVGFTKENYCSQFAVPLSLVAKKSKLGLKIKDLGKTSGYRKTFSEVLVLVFVLKQDSTSVLKDSAGSHFDFRSSSHRFRT